MILPNYDGVTRFDEFLILANVTNLNSSFYDIIIISDDQTQHGKDMRMGIMSENRNEDSFIAFKDYVELLVVQEKCFVYEILTGDDDKTTGCMWQTSFCYKVKL